MATLTIPFNAPFFTGATQSGAEVPVPFQVAIGGHGYVIDTKAYRRSTLEVIRQGFDPTGEPGEQSLSIEGLWKRWNKDWSSGAGQLHWDHARSMRDRYYTSQGIDIWSPFRFGLLPDTESKRASTNGNLKLLAAGAYLYVADGTEVRHTTDPTVSTPTWTSSDIQAGAGPLAVSSICTDGTRVYASLGANGIHRTVLGASTSAIFATGSYDLIGYALGYLLGAQGNVLSKFDNAGVATVIYTHVSTAASFVAIEGTPTCIFVGVNNGDRGEFFCIGYDSTTAALATPIAAGTLNDGETLYSMEFYQGRMLLGTSRGFRVAEIVEGTNRVGVSPGPVITQPLPVRCSTAAGEFAWFGISNYSGTVTGIGRANLAEATVSPLVPPWATDLMAATQGNVVSVAYFGKRAYFAVSGVGFYGPHATNLVSSGTINSGWIDFGTVERKVLASVDVRHEPLHGTVTLTVRTEDGGSNPLGTSAEQGSLGPPSPYGGENLTGEEYELILTLTRDALDASQGPWVTRWTLRGLVAPLQSDEIVVPLLLFSTVAAGGGDDKQPEHVDVLGEVNYLKSLEATRRVVQYREGAARTELVTVRAVSILEGGVRDWQWGDINYFDATVSVRMITMGILAE